MDPLILDIKRRFNNYYEEFKFVDKLFYFKKRLYIPEGPTFLWVL